MGNERGRQTVTRPYDVAWTNGSAQRPVDIRATRIVPSPIPFFTLPPELKPMEAAQAVWHAYQTTPDLAGKVGYVHCIQPDARMDLIVSRPQLLPTDVRLGKMQTDGFLRPVIDPALSEQENVRKLKERIAELQRLQRQGALEIKGFHTALDETEK